MMRAAAPMVALAVLLAGACHVPGRPCLTGFDPYVEGGRSRYKTPGYRGDVEKTIAAGVVFHFETVPGACDPLVRADRDRAGARL